MPLGTSVATQAYNEDDSEPGASSASVNLPLSDVSALDVGSERVARELHNTSVLVVSEASAVAAEMRASPVYTGVNDTAANLVPQLQFLALDKPLADVGIDNSTVEQYKVQLRQERVTNYNTFLASVAQLRAQLRDAIDGIKPAAHSYASKLASLSTQRRKLVIEAATVRAAGAGATLYQLLAAIGAPFSNATDTGPLTRETGLSLLINLVDAGTLQAFDADRMLIVRQYGGTFENAKVSVGAARRTLDSLLASRAQDVQNERVADNSFAAQVNASVASDEALLSQIRADVAAATQPLVVEKSAVVAADSQQLPFWALGTFDVDRRTNEAAVYTEYRSNISTWVKHIADCRSRWLNASNAVSRALTLYTLVQRRTGLPLAVSPVEASAHDAAVSAYNLTAAHSKEKLVQLTQRISTAQSTRIEYVAELIAAINASQARRDALLSGSAMPTVSPSRTPLSSSLGQPPADAEPSSTSGAAAATAAAVAANVSFLPASASVAVTTSTSAANGSVTAPAMSQTAAVVSGATANSSVVASASSTGSPAAGSPAVTASAPAVLRFAQLFEPSDVAANARVRGPFLRADTDRKRNRQQRSI